MNDKVDDKIYWRLMIRLMIRFIEDEWFKLLWDEW
jgi:hypothetical protein